MDVQRVAEQLLQRIESASTVPGDPFDRHIANQIRISEAIPGTQRGKEAVVASAKGLKHRFGPGAELVCSVGGKQGNIIISRKWVDASSQEAPHRAVLDELQALFHSLGEGTLIEIG